MSYASYVKRTALTQLEKKFEPHRVLFWAGRYGQEKLFPFTEQEIIRFYELSYKAETGNPLAQQVCEKLAPSLWEKIRSCRD